MANRPAVVIMTDSSFSVSNALKIRGLAYKQSDPLLFIENLLDLFELMRDKNYGARDVPFTEAAFAFLDDLKQNGLQKEGKDLLSTAHRIQITKLHTTYAPPSQQSDITQQAQQFFLDIARNNNSNDTDRLEAYLAMHGHIDNTIQEKAKTFFNQVIDGPFYAYTNRQKILAHMALCQHDQDHNNEKSKNQLRAFANGEGLYDRALRLRVLAFLPSIVIYNTKPLQLPFLEQEAKNGSAPIDIRIKSHIAWKETIKKTMRAAPETDQMKGSVDSLCKEHLDPLLADETKVVSVRTGFNSSTALTKNAVLLRILLSTSPDEITFDDLCNPDLAPYVKADEVLKLSEANLAAVTEMRKQRAAG